jgi:hypothetical protein
MADLRKLLDNDVSQIGKEESIEEKKESLTRLAQKITHALVIIYSAKHDTAKDMQQVRTIEEELQHATHGEIKDLEQVRNDIIRVLIAHRADIHWNGAVIERVLADLREQEVLLRDIDYIVRNDREEKIPQLERLVEQLLLIVEQAHHDLSTAKRTVSERR